MATFGKTAIGGTSIDGTAPKRGCKFSLSENGDVTSISVYGKKATAGTTTIDVAIYADSAGVPDALSAVGTQITIDTTLQWWTANISVSLVAGTYWLSWIQGTTVIYHYDAGSTNQEDRGSDALPFDDPWGADLWQDRDVSIYATYTPTAGAVTPLLMLMGVGT